MTVGELRAMIEGLSDDTVVKIATQPSYPFTHDVAGANLRHPRQGEVEELEGALTGELTDLERDEVNERLAELRAEGDVLYILEGGNQEYASADLWNV